MVVKQEGVISLWVACREGCRKHIAVCMRDGCSCEAYEEKVKELKALELKRGE